MIFYHIYLQRNKAPSSYPIGDRARSKQRISHSSGAMPTGDNSPDDSPAFGLNTHPPSFWAGCFKEITIYFS